MRTEEEKSTSEPLRLVRLFEREISVEELISSKDREIARLREALRRVMAASAKACEGQPVQRWAGFENGHGEEVGEELDAALCFARQALKDTGEGV